MVASRYVLVGPRRSDPTRDGFWNRPCPGPWDQHVGSLGFCGLLGALSSFRLELLALSASKGPLPLGQDR